MCSITLDVVQVMYHHPEYYDRCCVLKIVLLVEMGFFPGITRIAF